MKKKNRRRNVAVGKIVGRVFISLGLVLLLVLSLVYTLAYSVANGPSTTMRNTLVNMAMQASATKWAPGLVLKQSEVDAILAEAKRQNVEIIQDDTGSGIQRVRIDDKGQHIDPITTPPDDSNVRPDADIDWSQAVDGIYFKVINAPHCRAYVAIINDQIFAVGGTWMCKSDVIKAGDWAKITAQSKEAVDTMLGLHLIHVGINTGNEEEAAKIAGLISTMLNMKVTPGNSSIFVGNKEFEIMKKPGRGTNGHIAIGCNNVDRAIYHLSQRGVKFDLDSKNVKNGKTVACYMEGEIAGFAFHLVQA